MKLIIGNIIAFIASSIMAYTGILTNKKKILYLQTIQMGLFVISNLILGGFTGAIINVIGLIRNILCYKEKLNLKYQIVITFLSIVFSLLFNNLGLLGLLPLISAITYIWFMNTKSIKKFKILNIFTNGLWFIYELMIKSYTSSIFDLINIISNIVTIFPKNKHLNNVIDKSQ
jgi:hypothetical protein